MKYENEVTVEVNYSKDELYSILDNNDFKIFEEYDINDIYMIDTKYKNLNNPLDLLNHCILIRDIIASKPKKIVTYKYKEYNDCEEILKQGKVNMQIESIQDSIDFFNCLGYEKLININDHIVVFNNGVDELAVEFVNNKHIYIEIEDKCNYSNTVYKDIDEMKNLFKKYGISEIRNNNYFAKKAKDELLDNKSQIV